MRHWEPSHGGCFCGMLGRFFWHLGSRRAACYGAAWVGGSRCWGGAAAWRVESRQLGLSVRVVCRADVARFRVARLLCGRLLHAVGPVRCGPPASFGDPTGWGRVSQPTSRPRLPRVHRSTAIRLAILLCLLRIVLCTRLLVLAAGRHTCPGHPPVLPCCVCAVARHFVFRAASTSARFQLPA